jgi:hypothetical protein
MKIHADYGDEEMHAALDANIPNYASAIVTTAEILDSAFGDLVAAIVAFVAIPLMLRGSFLAKPLVWYIFEFTASHNVQHYILKVILPLRSDRDDVMVRFLD